MVAEGETCLLLAYRPFSVPQPFAEVGPVFLHAQVCPAYNNDVRPPREIHGDGRHSSWLRRA
ncbi:DUF1203 domain-containing protein [Devosia sp. UYZn731]|uniref:DUF1203 domain-containing protein n=1 Tax=Devosia sp. UYZn731 TaxID=3156345 RepID=UPI003390D13F